MTEESREQSFAQYWAARNAAVAYGLSEKFGDEQNLETAPTSTASPIVNVRLIKPSSGCIQVVLRGAGKPYILTYFRAPSRTDKTFDISSETLVTSEALRTQGQSGSMATQQPSVADEQSVEQIIWHVRTTLPLTYRVRLASRLSELQKAIQEEELDGRGISVRSLQRFVEFLEAHPYLRCPVVSITPDRNIYASWKSGSDRIFSIHFLPEGEIRFVIFRPNYKHPGQTIRLSGTATVDVVVSVARPHEVLSWASE